jgi:hypothetical protein
MARQAKGFPHQSAQAIATYGVSRGFHRDCETDTRKGEIVRFDAQPEEAIVDAAAGGVNRIEVQFAPQAQFRPKTIAAIRGLHGGPLTRR